MKKNKILRNPARVLFTEIAPSMVLILDKPLNESAIARKLGVTWGGNHHVLLILKREGIVSSVSKDGRSNTISLTEKGKLLKEEIEEILKLLGCKKDDLRSEQWHKNFDSLLL